MTAMQSQTRQAKYDLEDRTFQFAWQVRAFVKRLPRIICNQEDGRQLVRGSGSPGANYIEANEALSKKDFRLRIKICRKETKESRYWLRLGDFGGGDELEQERLRLVNESQELIRIFSAILRNSE
jgi:four helix bundle protein